MIPFGSLTSGTSDAGEEFIVTGLFGFVPATPFVFRYVDDAGNPYTNDIGDYYTAGDF